MFPPVSLAKNAPICQLKRVIDGDTAIFRCPGWRRAETVRIVGYNAPDRCQARYHEATQWLANTLKTGTISLSTRGRDQYQRVLAKVFVDGKRLSAPRELTAMRKKCD